MILLSGEMHTWLGFFIFRLSNQVALGHLRHSESICSEDLLASYVAESESRNHILQPDSN